MFAAVIRNYTRTKLTDCKTESSTEEEEKIISSALRPRPKRCAGMFFLSRNHLSLTQKLKLLHKSLLSFSVEPNYEQKSENVSFDYVFPPQHPSSSVSLCGVLAVCRP